MIQSKKEIKAIMEDENFDDCARENKDHYFISLDLLEPMDQFVNAIKEKSIYDLLIYLNPKYLLDYDEFNDLVYAYNDLNYDDKQKVFNYMIHNYVKGNISPLDKYIWALDFKYLLSTELYQLLRTA